MTFDPAFMEPLLVLVASNVTRIEESKGLLLISYRLEALTPNGWQRLPGCATFKWAGCRFPELEAGTGLRSEPYSSPQAA